MRHPVKQGGSKYSQVIYLPMRGQVKTSWGELEGREREKEKGKEEEREEGKANASQRLIVHIQFKTDIAHHSMITHNYLCPQRTPDQIWP